MCCVRLRILTDDNDAGALFKWQLRKAKYESVVQDQVFEIFSSCLPSKSVVEWIAEVEAYERDPSLPDPYYREIKGESSFSRGI